MLAPVTDIITCTGRTPGAGSTCAVTSENPTADLLLRDNGLEKARMPGVRGLGWWLFGPTMLVSSPGGRLMAIGSSTVATTAARYAHGRARLPALSHFAVFKPQSRARFIKAPAISA